MLRLMTHAITPLACAFLLVNQACSSYTHGEFTATFAVSDREVRVVSALLQPHDVHPYGLKLADPHTGSERRSAYAQA